MSDKSYGAAIGHHVLIGGDYYQYNGVDWINKTNKNCDKTPNYREIEWRVKLNLEELRKIELLQLMVSRPLTLQEQKEVAKHGMRLNISPNCPYNEKEKKEEMCVALLQQFKLQVIQKMLENNDISEIGDI